MKKVFKFILKGVLGLFILGVLTYGGFRLNEYFIGNKYVKYLKENSQSSFPISDSVTFKFDKDFGQNQFFY